jgi:hypothetical protein
MAAPAAQRVWAWIVGGNTLARLGVVLLFIGVGFLLKYAVEHVRCRSRFASPVSRWAASRCSCSAGACASAGARTRWCCRAAAWACCI